MFNIQNEDSEYKIIDEEGTAWYYRDIKQAELTKDFIKRMRGIDVEIISIKKE